MLDLTRVLAGPFCSMMLGDMGAEVIKVEEPGKGDDTRSWPPFAGGEATYFIAVNRGKKSLTLNLKAPEGQEILRKLVRRSDVLIENFRPGTMGKLGFGYAALARLKTELATVRAGGTSEILDVLIVYKWQDLFGPFTQPPAEISHRETETRSP